MSGPAEREVRDSEAGETAEREGRDSQIGEPAGRGYLHGHHDAVLRSHRERTAENSAAYLLPRLRPGASLLDVGCGPGTITVGLAAHLPGGRVIGIDAAAQVLEEAEAHAAEQRRATDADLDFQVADVYALPFATGEFDVVHAHQVLQHLADPVAALVEMRRVCRPGGVVAVRDADYGAMFWSPERTELAAWQALYRSVARSVGGEPDAGRQLRAWALGAGLSTVDQTASAWCFATPAERTWWAGLWAERVTSSRFAELAVAGGFAEPEELRLLATGWLRWAEGEDACFVVPHVELLCEVSAAPATGE